MRRALPMFLCLVLAAGASAQDVEVWILRDIQDEPLGKMVEETLMIGDLDVEIEPALMEKRVTVMLDHQLVGALNALARAAGAHLWKLGAKRYAIRSAPPPPSAKPPAEEVKDSGLFGEEEEGEETEEEAPPLPEWKQKIQTALEEGTFDGKWEKTHLTGILADLANAAGVPIHLDPAVLRSRSRKELTLDYEHPLETNSVEEILFVFCGFQKLGFDLQWGVVFVSTLERSLVMPASVFREGFEYGSDEDAATFEDSAVTISLKSASLKKAIESLNEAGGVSISVGPEAVKLCRRRKYTIEFTGQSLVNALSILLVPEGLVIAAAEQGLVVTVRE